MSLQQEGEDYHFEPKFCSDYVLIYEGARFHLHKQILAKESQYFFALLQGDRESKEILVPSIQRLGTHAVVTVKEFQEFFQIVYDHGRITCSYSCIDPFASLAHYFDFTFMNGCMELEVIRYHGNRQLSLEELVGNALFVQECKWTCFDSLFLEALAKAACDLISHRNWNKFPSRRQCEVLRRALARERKSSLLPSSLKSEVDVLLAELNLFPLTKEDVNKVIGEMTEMLRQMYKIENDYLAEVCRTKHLVQRFHNGKPLCLYCQEFLGESKDPPFCRDCQMGWRSHAVM